MSKVRSAFAAVLFSAAIGLAFSGCAWFGKEKPANPLVGTWLNVARTTWTIKENGTYEVDIDHNGWRDSWGKYWIKGDTVTVTGGGGITPKGCDGRGVYRFVREGDILRLTLVSDACRLRRKNLQLLWRLQP